MCLAIPGKIVEIEGDDLFRRARVSFGGIVREINLSYVPEAEVGSYVLAHVGVAISLIDEAEAVKVFAWRAEIDQLDDLALPIGEAGEAGEVWPRA